MTMTWRRATAFTSATVTRAATLIACIALVLSVGSVVVVGSWFVQRSDDQRRALVESCVRGNVLRSALSDFLDTITHNAPDNTLPPGFAKLAKAVRPVDCKAVI